MGVIDGVIPRIVSVLLCEYYGVIVVNVTVVGAAQPPHETKTRSGFIQRSYGCTIYNLFI